MTQRRNTFTVSALIAWVLALVLVTAQTGFTQEGCAGLSLAVNPFAFEQKTIDATARPLTAAVYAPSGQVPAAAAFITTETADLRFRVDGTDPTAAVGHKLTVASTLTLCGRTAIANFRGIRTGATNADLFASYFRTR